MIINAKNGEKQVFPNFKGGDGQLDAVMFFDGSNRILYGELEPGSSIGYHKHEGNCEMIYILSGKATYCIDGETELAAPGQCHYCPEGHSHSMTNEGPEKLCFFAVVPKQ